ncbi:MAG: 5-oxoprolinase, partial [Gammaproteobacteria bacterium]
MANSWLFAADRGGTFTDLIGIDPKGRIHSRKLRSESPAYADAAIAGIRQLLQLADDEPIPPDQVTAIRIGTTVATNALLERKGEPTALLITKGFGDLLEIGNQSRPDIFALAIEKPEQLYQQVSEVNERLDASGEIILDLDEQPIIDQLQHWQKQGIGAIAVALMHSWINPIHELRIGELAVAAGFKQISLSHQ